MTARTFNSWSRSVPGSRTTFWGFPGWRNLAYAYGVLGPLLLVCFVLIYKGADYLTGLHDYCVRSYANIELAIPFVPVMVIFYNSLHVLYGVTPFIVRTRRELNAMATVLVLITLFGGIVFLILLAEDAYPTDETLGVWKTMFCFADRANLRYNSCPSLHVAWAIVCVDIFATRARFIGKTAMGLWGVVS